MYYNAEAPKADNFVYAIAYAHICSLIFAPASKVEIYRMLPKIHRKTLKNNFKNNQAKF